MAIVLAVDVGGTRTRTALVDTERIRHPLLLRQQPTADIASLTAYLDEMCKTAAVWPRALAVAVAGPVFGGRSVQVNVNWSVDAEELRTALGIASVRVLNDLEAAAHALAELEPKDYVELQPSGLPIEGNRAIIAAGTGLGEAGLYWDGSAHQPFATEGGHASFSPTDELEEQLLRWLRKRFEHVSWERVVSGPGLARIFEFLAEGEGKTNVLHDRLGSAEDPGDLPAWIAEQAERGDPLCRAALRLFCRLYGSEAGNLALKLMATGGVYVAGSVAVKNLETLREGAFLEGFRNKGRMRPLLEAIPVRVVLFEELVLLGAARCAAKLLVP